MTNKALIKARKELRYSKFVIGDMLERLSGCDENFYEDMLEPHAALRGIEQALQVIDKELKKK